MQVRSAAGWSLCLPFMVGCWLSLRARLLVGSFAQVCLKEKTYLKLSLGNLKFRKGLHEHELGYVWVLACVALDQSGAVSPNLCGIYFEFPRCTHKPLLKEKVAIWDWGYSSVTSTPRKLRREP